MDVTEIVAILATLVVLPGMIFLFVSTNKKRKAEIEKMKYQKELLELEIEKEKAQIKRLEEENKKYDKIINDSE
jgi:beta-lactam-binding protein with PASTA domain